MRLKFLAALYILLLVAIVYCADHRNYLYLFTFIRSVPGGDKCGHFILMGVFTGLLNLCLSCRWWKVAGRSFLLGSVIAISIITLEEFSQIFVPYRSFDLTDLAADYLGVFIFGRLALLLSRKQASGLVAE